MATQTPTTELKPNGLAAATLLAGGFGAFLMGLITLLSEIPLTTKAVGPALNWINPVGPLSGKTILTVILWLVVWAILGFSWKGKDKDFGKISMISMGLLLLGILGTFPLFWKLFG
jgi:hypothetical protein